MNALTVARMGFLRSILFLVACSFGFAAQAQLTVDAGPDSVYCSSGAVLGGSPTVSGGTPPYVYSWTTRIPYAAGIQYAASALDDSTSANPEVLDIASDTTALFFVTVMDAGGQVASDSVFVGISKVTAVTADCIYWIEPGESAMLWLGATTNFFTTPQGLLWSPSTGFDPTNPSPTVMPWESTEYTASYSDDVGCPLTWTCTVELLMGLGHPDRVHIEVYPNPAPSHFRVSLEHFPADVEVVNALGQVQHRQVLQSAAEPIATQDWASGLYRMRVHQDGVLLGHAALMVP